MTIRESVKKNAKNYGWSYFYRVYEYKSNHMDDYTLLWQGGKLEELPTEILDKEYRHIFSWEETRTTSWGILDTITIECR